MKKTTLHNQYRNFSIRSGDIDIDNRTVDLSFSSEEPVSRYFGEEILDHTPSSVDMSRLLNNAPVLEDHKDGQIGVVLDAKIVDGRGIAKVKFSQNGRGADVFQDIQDGIRSNVSFGYQLKNLTEVDNADEPTFRSMDWMPFEISIVGVPADNTIGIGRSKEDGNEVEVSDSFRDLKADEPKKEDLDAVMYNEKAKEKPDFIEEKPKGANARLKWLSLLEKKYKK